MKLSKVTRVGGYKKKTEEVGAGCLRWKTCVVRLWQLIENFPRDEIEDDLTFDGTNLDDFVDNLQLSAEEGGGNDEEKKKRLVERTEKSQNEDVKRIVEEAWTWQGILIKLQMTYTQMRQDQTKRERLQEKGLWIGREKDELQRKTQEEGEEKDVPLRGLRSKPRTFPKDRRSGADQAVEKEEEEKKEVAVELKKDQGKIRESGKEIGEMEKGRNEKEVCEDSDALGKGLRSELKGSIELSTQRFIDYIPGLLKEMSRLRKREEERDVQMTRLIEDLKGMRKEVEDLNKGKEELLKQVSTLEVPLAQKGKELEDEVVEREKKMEKKVEGLCSGISVQGEDLEKEITEREKMSQIWEMRWNEILKEMKELKLSHQEKEKETTRVVEWKDEEGFKIKMTAGEREESLSIKEEERKDEQTEVGKEGPSSKRPQEQPRVEGPPASEEEKSECLALPQQKGIKRNGQPGMKSSEGAGSQTETSAQSHKKKARYNKVRSGCFFCTKE
ncbi:hypothetical protein CBR_g45334 [Chara braunii]|uniref:Uncharacterized protein n=1 Tax=Chara braunii TaxID=69332 RepID=A0A388LY72_CHABU|nr:hypothetical protein CBR_g45334 [Chara braunii]|eukprot:GBG87274.1 hypothetical protein CBR_g45334 [Chara braunii]